MRLVNEKLCFLTIMVLSFMSGSLLFSQEIDNNSGNNENVRISKPEDILNKRNSSSGGGKSTSVEVRENSGYHFGVWINYQQQFGAINKDFITIGGPSFGFNLGNHFLIGAGVYSTFGSLEFKGHSNEHSFVYGGGILGFRWNPQHPVVFRTQALIGAIAFDVLSSETLGTIESRHTTLIIVPEIALDIRLAGYLYLTLSASYKYVLDIPEQWKGLEGLGALTGNVSLGFSF